MKRILFFLFLLPCIAGAQNYLFEITPHDGVFDLKVSDNSRESEPLNSEEWFNKDTAWIQLTAYQRIQNVRGREASLRIQALIADLNAEQTAEAIGAVVPLDYQTWINEQLVGVYNGNYQYTVRGTAINLPVVISGGNLLRASDNVVLATLSARANNWIRATVVGSGEVVELYQFGNTWVGKNNAGQFVTLKRL